MIGIDVGGANLKVVDKHGTAIYYCPLWEEAPLPDLLSKHAGDAAVVMSGELADCFSDKMEGVSAIVDLVRSVFPRSVFYGTDGRFHDHAVPQLAAANWVASADFLKDLYPDSVFVDIGSTTADIIPLPLFPDLLGMTDIRRLQEGYLVYSGMLRTPVATIVRSVPVEGVDTPVATEYFASSADVHRVLGHISPEEYTVPAADCGDSSREACLRRLARLVCADLSEIGEQAALGIAGAFWDAQRSEITSRVEAAMERSDASNVIVAGIGSRTFADDLGATDLRSILGPSSDALPAYAVREVALRTAGR